MKTACQDSFASIAAPGVNCRHNGCDTSTGSSSSTPIKTRRVL